MNVYPFTVIIGYLEAWTLHGGYIFLFVSSILEAVPLIGSTIPGHTIVILYGLLARIGVVNVYLVGLLASAGAVIGDMIGYYMGKKYGLALIEKYKGRLFVREEYLERARAMIGRHTGKSLIAGRFNPITRPFMPFIVGASGAPDKKFWFYNILGGILWAISGTAIGYVFGIGYDAVASVFGKAVVVVIAVGSVAIWGYNIVNRRFHIFRKYEIFVLALNLFSLFIFLRMVQDAWAATSFMAKFDIWLNLAIQKYATLPFIYAAQAVSDLVGGYVIVIISMIVGLYLIARKKWRSAVIAIFSVTATIILSEFVKALFLRERPDDAFYIIFDDPSFPSGHSAVAAAFFVTLAYLALPHIRSMWRREMMLVFCAFAAFAVGLSRIVLNLHWASDVFAGWSLGIFTATATILLVRYVGALIVNRITDKD